MYSNITYAILNTIMLLNSNAIKLAKSRYHQKILIHIYVYLLFGITLLVYALASKKIESNRLKKARAEH